MKVKILIKADAGENILTLGVVCDNDGVVVETPEGLLSYVVSYKSSDRDTKLIHKKFIYRDEAHCFFRCLFKLYQCKSVAMDCESFLYLTNYWSTENEEDEPWRDSM